MSCNWNVVYRGDVPCRNVLSLLTFWDWKVLIEYSGCKWIKIQIPFHSRFAFFFKWNSAIKQRETCHLKCSVRVAVMSRRPLDFLFLFLSEPLPSSRGFFHELAMQSLFFILPFQIYLTAHYHVIFNLFLCCQVWFTPLFIYSWAYVKYMSFMFRWDMELILHSCWRWNCIMVTGIGQCYSWNCTQNWTDWGNLHFQVIFQSNYGSIFLSLLSKVCFLIQTRQGGIWLGCCFTLSE